MRALVVVGVVAGLGNQAAADDADRYRSDVERIAGSLKNPAARRGVETAPAASGNRPGWCGPPSGPPNGAGFGIHLDSFYGDPVTKQYALVAAAEALCKNDPAHPTIKAATREVVQLWMNIYGLSPADAVDSLRLTVDKATNEDSQKKVCAALELDSEIGGADRAFIRAKRDLFDCPGSSDDRISRVGGNSPMVELVPWLDSSAKPPDELVRLAYVSKEVLAFSRASGDYREKVMLAYAVDQFDIKALDPKKALALADVEPFKGNPYARVTIKETLGLTRLALLQLDEEIKKKTDKDPDWKELIITAPQRGYNEWVAAASKYKAELQRSADFEQTAFGPSKKASAGCQKTLKADLVPILKSLKRETLAQFHAEMNKHPVAGLLFRRYQACVAVDGDKSAAAEMTRIEGIRVLRGPRAAAYYAVMDALGKIRADRAKFSVEERDIPAEHNDILEKLTDDLARGHDATAYSVWEEDSVIKTVKKGKDGINVVFATDKQQRWSENCKTLNRIIMFERDGKPIYDRSCTGKVVTVDVKSKPINVPEALADGLAPGRAMRFGVSNSQERRISMPFEVYSDKKGKNLVAYYGIEIK